MKGVPTEAFLKLIEPYNLSNAQLAQLTRISAYTDHRGTSLYRHITRYRNGATLVPLNVFELLASKLAAVELGLASLDEVCTIPLDELLRRAGRSPRDVV